MIRKTIQRRRHLMRHDVDHLCGFNGLEMCTAFCPEFVPFSTIQTNIGTCRTLFNRVGDSVRNAVIRE